MDIFPSGTSLGSPIGNTDPTIIGYCVVHQLVTTNKSRLLMHYLKWRLEGKIVAITQSRWDAIVAVDRNFAVDRSVAIDRRHP